MRSVQRLAALFLFEQLCNDFTARGQAHFVAFDIGNQSFGNVMVMLLVSDAAVRTNKLNSIVFNSIDGADMNSIGSNHFHVLANIIKSAHRISLLLLSPLNAPRGQWDARSIEAASLGLGTRHPAWRVVAIPARS